MDRCPMHAVARYVCEWQHRESAQERADRVRLTRLRLTGTVVSNTK